MGGGGLYARITRRFALEGEAGNSAHLEALTGLSDCPPVFLLTAVINTYICVHSLPIYKIELYFELNPNVLLFVGHRGVARRYDTLSILSHSVLFSIPSRLLHQCIR